MPFITQCPKCGKKLKAPDDRAGQQAKCPQCKNPFTIEPADNGSPAATPVRPSVAASTSTPKSQPATPAVAPVPHVATPTASAPASTSPPSWHVQTADGTRYGPVTKAELDAWVADDRLDKECQVLMDGWDQWKWAEEVYPQLAAAVAHSASEHDSPAPDGFPIVDEGNPYASPVADMNRGSANAAGEIDSMRIVKALQQTRPWVLMFAIFAFLASAGAALYLVIGVITMLVVPVMGLAIVVLATGYGAFYVYVGVVLIKYANACDAFARKRTQLDLENAIEAQRNFWKFVGIMTLAVIGISVAAILLIMVAGGVAANAGSQGGFHP